MDRIKPVTCIQHSLLVSAIFDQIPDGCPAIVWGPEDLAPARLIAMIFGGSLSPDDLKQRLLSMQVKPLKLKAVIALAQYMASAMAHSNSVK